MTIDGISLFVTRTIVGATLIMTRAICCTLRIGVVAIAVRITVIEIASIVATGGRDTLAAEILWRPLL